MTDEKELRLKRDREIQAQISSFTRQSTPYFLRYPDGKFVGVDLNSGGYPYPTSWWDATPFFELEKAKSYCQMFGDRHLEVVKIECKVVKVD